MKPIRRMGGWLLLGWVLCVARPVLAQETVDASASASDNPLADGIPLACDGALCDTTTNQSVTCDIGLGGARRSAAPVYAVAALLLLLLARRRVAVGGLALILIARAAVAAPPPPVDVKIDELPPRLRHLTISWNPLPLILTKLSFDVIVAPKPHHAIVISPSYFWNHTSPVFVYDDQQNATQLPKQYFEGGGGELGYRYYFGRGGLRGWFIGPSFLASWITATAMNGDKLSFLQYGAALDAGYQILIADRFSINLAAGLQYTANNKDVPKQQFPVSLTVNGGVLPRFLLSFGCAL